MKVLLNRKLWLFLPLLGALGFLLFFARSDVFDTRSWREVWNLGHIPLFILAGYAAYRFYPQIQNTELSMQVLLLAAMGFGLGLSIEFVQSFVQRQASLHDVMLDTLGAVIAVPLFSRRAGILTVWYKLLGLCLISALLLLASWQFILASWDEIQAYRELPLLADFEQSRELKRWTGDARREIVTDVFTHGAKSLKVSLGRKYYSGVEFQYFPSDWSDYTLLTMQVFNPGTELISLTVSIFDVQHKANHFAFHDRYTDQFHLRPGWNGISIFIDELINAPRKRQMDLSNVRGVRLFMVKPVKGQYFYIDNVRLEK